MFNWCEWGISLIERSSLANYALFTWIFCSLKVSFGIMHKKVLSFRSGYIHVYRSYKFNTCIKRTYQHPLLAFSLANRGGQRKT